MARNRPSKLVVVQWTTCLVGSVGNILVLVVLAWRRRRPFQVKFGIHCRSRMPYWTQSKPSTDGTLVQSLWGYSGLLFYQILRYYIVVVVVLAWRRSRSQVGTQVFVSKARSGRSYLSQSEAELSPSTGDGNGNGNGILSDICRVGQRRTMLYCDR